MYKIVEKKFFVTADDKHFVSEKDAKVHQGRLDFLLWCENNICRGGNWDAAMVGEAILEHFHIKSKET